jgi:murein L,D-transpeptidase YcbB/YkuD
MDRDFSHGCIRLQDPEKMANWVFQQSGTDWTPDKIHEAMTDSTHVRVNLKNPIPVVITYATAEVNPSGQVYFFNDVYGLDASLNKQFLQQDQQRSSPANQQTAVQQESALRK